MSFHAAFQPLGSTGADRCRQFERACDAGHTADGEFWIAVLVLGIDADMGQAYDALAKQHGAPDACCLSYKGKRDSVQRRLRSIALVRSRWGCDWWHTLARHGATIPTTLPVNCADNLSTLSREHALDDASLGLRHALQQRRPGPTAAILLDSGVRTVQNVDIMRTRRWLQERGRTAPAPDDGAGEEEQDHDPDPDWDHAQHQQTDRDHAQHQQTRPRKRIARDSLPRRRKPKPTMETPTPTPTPSPPPSPSPSPERARRDNSHTHAPLDTPPSQSRNNGPDRASPVDDSHLTASPSLHLHHDQEVDSALIDPALQDPHLFLPDRTGPAAPDHPSSPCPEPRNIIGSGGCAEAPPSDTSMPPKRISNSQADDTDNYARVVQLHSQLRQNLAAAYDAVRDAAEALRQAREKLDQLIDKCPPALHPRTNTNAEPSTPPHAATSPRLDAVKRLDTRITSLQDKTTPDYAAHRQYAAVFPTLAALPHIYGNMRDINETERLLNEDRDKQLRELILLREQLRQADYHVRQLEDDYGKKKALYDTSLKSWVQMRAQIPDWEPPDGGTMPLGAAH
ncbi:hypothetical protein ACEQ8H_008398 [Pleosporales sp. CAS-2024a]